MKAAAFSYVRATTRAEAFQLLAAGGPDAKVLAGGQSLLAALAFRLSQPPVLIDIGRVAEFKGIALAGDTLRIGALTTHRELGASDLIKSHAPLLTAATHVIAHPAIRNRGTLGGSLAYADPAAELPACMLALDAVIIAASAKGERRIPAKAFFTGLFSTALAADELIAAVEVPSQAAVGRRGVIHEIARRSGDYAMAGVALTAKVNGGQLTETRAAFFGLGDTAVLTVNTAKALDGTTGDASAITAAAEHLTSDLNPPEDQHGSSAMKQHLAGVVFARAVRALLSGDGAAS